MEIINLIPIIIGPLIGVIQRVRNNKVIHNLIRGIVMQFLRRMSRPKKEKPIENGEDDNTSSSSSSPPPPPSSPRSKNKPDKIKELQDIIVLVVENQKKIAGGINYTNKKIEILIVGVRLFFFSFLLYIFWEHITTAVHPFITEIRYWKPTHNLIPLD